MLPSNSINRKAICFRACVGPGVRPVCSAHLIQINGTEFHETGTVDDVGLAQSADRLIDFEGRRIKVNVTARSNV